MTPFQKHYQMSRGRRIPPTTTSSIPVYPETWVPRRTPTIVRSVRTLAVQQHLPQLYGYPLGLGAEGADGLTPTESVSDQELRRCGMDPAAVRGLEREFASMGMGLGLGGIFGDIWGGIKKVGGAVAKVVPGVIKYIPGVGPIASDVIKFGAGLIAPKKVSPPLISTQAAATMVPSVLKMLARAKAKAGEQQTADSLTEKAGRIERAIEQAAPPTPIIIQGPAGPSVQSAGMPGWLPIALLAVAGFALMKGKR
jgi:hypothetical protein